jgi:hypothetical protein
VATHLQSVLGSNIAVTFDSASYHFTFAVASGDVIFYTGNSTCFSILGFSTAIDHASSSGYLESDELVDLSGLTSIDVYSSLLCRNWPLGTTNIYSN